MGNSASQAMAVAKAQNGLKNVLNGIDGTDSTTAEEDKARLEKKHRIRDQRDSALIDSYKAKKQERAARKAKLAEKWANNRKQQG